MEDLKGRTIDYLRISVTDRCNLRCLYCMPKEGISCLKQEDILCDEEIVFIAQAFAELGIKKIKITGGEPLIRKNLVELVRRIKEIEGVEEVTMTTNGLLFAAHANNLKQAGLSAVNFSLDSLSPQKYLRICGMEDDSDTMLEDGPNGICSLDRVREAIDTALSLQLKTKINCVPIKGYNEDEIPKLAALAKDAPLDVRFIELMPLGCGKQFTYIPKAEILTVLEKIYGKPEEVAGRYGNGPAAYVKYPGFQGRIGFISAMSECFCESCNRIRMTAEGDLKLCLHYDNGISLREQLRKGISKKELKDFLYTAIRQKPEHHEFGRENVEHSEERKMMQIGG